MILYMYESESLTTKCHQNIKSYLAFGKFAEDMAGNSTVANDDGQIGQPLQEKGQEKGLGPWGLEGVGGGPKSKNK